MKQNDRPEFLHCAHFDTQHQSEQKIVEHGYKLNYQWQKHWLISECFSNTDFYLATCFVSWWFSNLTHPVQLLCFENIMYSALGHAMQGHAMQKSLKLITIDSAAVPTLTRLQSGPCIHLKLLMYSSSAANGKYHCKSPTLPGLQGPKRTDTAIAN